MAARSPLRVTLESIPPSSGTWSGALVRVTGEKRDDFVKIDLVRGFVCVERELHAATEVIRAIGSVCVPLSANVEIPARLAPPLSLVLAEIFMSEFRDALQIKTRNSAFVVVFGE